MNHPVWGAMIASLARKTGKVSASRAKGIAPAYVSASICRSAVWITVSTGLIIRQREQIVMPLYLSLVKMLSGLNAFGISNIHGWEFKVR